MRVAPHQCIEIITISASLYLFPGRVMQLMLVYALGNIVRRLRDRESSTEDGGRRSGRKKILIVILMTDLG